MNRIGASDARRHLHRLLDRAARGESLTITHHGKPVERLVSLTSDRSPAEEAAARIVERRKHLTRVPLADLMATIHEGHCQ